MEKSRGKTQRKPHQLANIYPLLTQFTTHAWNLLARVAYFILIHSVRQIILVVAKINNKFYRIFLVRCKFSSFSHSIVKPSAMLIFFISVHPLCISDLLCVKVDFFARFCLLILCILNICTKYIPFFRSENFRWNDVLPLV